MALNADDYTENKYRVVTAKAEVYAETPCLCCVNDPRKLMFALHLIEQLMAKMAVTKGEEQNVDYYAPFEETSALLERKLINELHSEKDYDKHMAMLAKQKTSGLENSASNIVSASEVNKLMDNSEASEKLADTTK